MIHFNNETLEIIHKGFSINDICINLYGYSNSRVNKELKKLIKDNNIDISHFKNKNKKYNIIKSICPVCNLEFEKNENSKKTTCSFSCANKHFRSEKSINTKDKISKSLKDFHKKNISEIKINRLSHKQSPIKNCLNYNKSLIRNCLKCNQEFIRKRSESGRLSNAKYCSENCAFESMISNIKKSHSKRISDGKHKGWISRNIESYPEKFFKKVLNKNNIYYEFNKPVKKKDLGVDCNSNYFLDFYIPNGNIDLEIDGKQHEYPHNKLKDGIRDDLISKFYNIYRIKWKAISTPDGKEYIRNEINKFINYYNEINGIKKI